MSSIYIVHFYVLLLQTVFSWLKVYSINEATRFAVGLPFEIVLVFKRNPDVVKPRKVLYVAHACRAAISSSSGSAGAPSATGVSVGIEGSGVISVVVVSSNC